MIIFFFVFLLGLMTGLNAAFFWHHWFQKPKPVEPPLDSDQINCQVSPGTITFNFSTATLLWVLDQHPHAIEFQITPEMHKLLTPPTSN